MTGESLRAAAGRRRLAAGGSAALLRVAGYGAMGAIATLVVAGVALGIFFSDTEAFAVFGPINDVTTAATIFLILPAVAVLHRLTRDGRLGWFRTLSMLTMAGMVIAAAGLLLLVVRVIDLQGSFIIGGLGMLPFLGWVAAVGYLALRGRLLSRTLGWWIAAFLGLTVLAIGAAPFVSMQLLTFTVFPVLAVTLGGWLFVMGRDLLRTAEASSAG